MHQCGRGLLAAGRFLIGDVVAYSVVWLHSIGEVPLGELCHWRGRIIALQERKGIAVATVDWGEHVSNVLTCNLAKPGTYDFCNCGQYDLVGEEIAMKEKRKKEKRQKRK